VKATRFPIAFLLISSLQLAPLEASPAEKLPQNSDHATASLNIVSSVADAKLRDVLVEALEQNPNLAVLTSRAAATEQRAPQVRALPDPVASLTLFLLRPQTRVGPQQAAAGISQRLPWFGKLKLAQQAAVLEAAAARARIEIERLKLVTEVRVLYLELQYLEKEHEIVSDEKTTLEHYEQLAQARYASGVGTDQTVIKVQAEITRARTRLLGIDRRRVSVIAEINALRDRPGSTSVKLGLQAPFRGELPSIATMRHSALSSRPELVEANALIDAAAVRTDLARQQSNPDFTIGLSYALVGRRNDPAGQFNPPDGNGDDILGLSGGITLPIWREKIAAGVEQAAQLRLASEQIKRAISAEIEADLSDLYHRIPLLIQQSRLFDEVLVVQAEESLRSAETAYASGTAGALDLLDAERTLLGVRIASERTSTDLAIAVAELEGVLGGPLQPTESFGGAS
jgi:outer membrane protein TolC